jgi:hypothetical protein
MLAISVFIPFRLGISFFLMLLWPLVVCTPQIAGFSGFQIVVILNILAQLELLAFFKVLEDQSVLFFAVALHRLQSFHFILLFGMSSFPKR